MVSEPGIRAREFHEAYEMLAPQFGYTTRENTRQFDPASPNGKLMIAVMEHLTRLQARPDASEPEETCPICEGREMRSGEFCLAGCRDGKVLWTSANVLRNIKPWWDADQRTAGALRAHLTEQITHVQTRIQDGKEMGAAVWRIALEDIVRENTAVLASLRARSTAE